MNKKQLKNLIVILIMIVAFVLCAAIFKSSSPIKCPVCHGEDVACETCDGAGYMSSNYYATFMALVPPVIAIVLALISKEVYSSLLIGIIFGGMLYANFKPIEVVYTIVDDGLISAVSSTAGIFIFLIILGILVALINQSGGSRAFGRWAETHIKTRAGAILATFFLGVLIFIDDYFNCLTVGSVMRSVTDSHKISRVKLAYLIDSTAAPVCMIAPISSWAAAVSEYVEDGQGLTYFIKAIPFNFYSLLTLVFIVVTGAIGLEYGKMARFEILAEGGDLSKNGNNIKSNPDSEAANNPRGKVFDIIIPIIMLVACCVLALIHNGGFFDAGDTAHYHRIAEAFGNTDSSLALPLGAGVALILIIIYLLARRLITFGDAMKSIPKGFNAMVPAIIILTLATSLKNMTGLLGAKYFVAGLLDNASALMSFLPAIAFLIAAGLSFSTGTSWGTFGILIPIVSAAIGLDSPLGIISMSACLAGAVCGDHCSPISDTTIMASAGAECNHVSHVETQLPYAMTVALTSLVSYIFAGFVQNWYIALPTAIVLQVAVIFGIKFFTSKKAKT